MSRSQIPGGQPEQALTLAALWALGHRPLRNKHTQPARPGDLETRRGPSLPAPSPALGRPTPAIYRSSSQGAQTSRPGRRGCHLLSPALRGMGEASGQLALAEQGSDCPSQSGNLAQSQHSPSYTKGHQLLPPLEDSMLATPLPPDRHLAEGTPAPSGPLQPPSAPSQARRKQAPFPAPPPPAPRPSSLLLLRHSAFRDSGPDLCSHCSVLTSSYLSGGLGAPQGQGPWPPHPPSQHSEESLRSWVLREQILANRLPSCPLPP